MARTAYIAVRNWERYQHYKDGRPLIWIKFHIELLDDPELRSLPADIRLYWDQLLLLAGRTNNCIKGDMKWISECTALDLETVQNGTHVLLKGAWLRRFHSRRALESARTDSRLALDLARSRERREEKRREEDPPTPLTEGGTEPRPSRAEGTNPRAAAAAETAAARENLHQQLLEAASEIAADWNDGGSDVFDDKLDAVERRYPGTRLSYLERDTLWDTALQHRPPDSPADEFEDLF